MGYQAREIAVVDTSPLKVTLAEEAHKVEDVVIVGYGVQKKESVLGAISQVNNEQLVNSGTTNITNAITGKLSGVTTIQASGQPGNNDADIFVRGVSSWNGSKPLVLVDGVERSFTDLDPNEVASISVLKDASAAIYGIGAADGVILITTKKGSEGTPRISYEGSYTFTRNYKYLDVLDAQEYMNIANVYSKENYLYNNKQYPYGGLAYDGRWTPVFSPKRSPGPRRPTGPTTCCAAATRPITT